MDENNTSARNKFLYLSGLFMKKKTFECMRRCKKFCEGSECIVNVHGERTNCSECDAPWGPGMCSRKEYIFFDNQEKSIYSH